MNRTVNLFIGLAFVCLMLLLVGWANCASLTVCENNRTHKVRLPAIGSACRTDEIALMLAGPAGPTGPSGPTGATGPSGGPSLDLEGMGTLVGSTCDVGGCHGTLTATGISLSIPVLINPTKIGGLPNGSPPCYNLASTSGTLGTQTVILEGQLCVDGFQYVVSASLNSDVTADICQSAPKSVIAAQLTAYGAVSTNGPPLPESNPIPAGVGSGIVSVIGTMGQIASPCPSP